MTDTLTPSEAVLLAPSRFAGPASFKTGTHAALDGSGEVAESTLAEAVLMAALLGLERDGAITLVREPKKELFGLRKTHTVYAERVPGGPAPPAGTPEAALLAAVPEQRAEVDRVVAAWLDEDVSNPDATVLALVCGGLVRRGLVQTTETKTKKWLFTHTNVSFTPTDAARALVGDVEALRALVTDAGGRPDLAETLRVEVRQGLASRVAHEDYDIPD